MLSTLLFVAAYVVPCIALGFVLFRLFRTRGLVSESVRTSVRAKARQEAAERAALVAEAGHAEALARARESLAQTGAAIAVARNIERVGVQVGDLTEYIVGLVEGAQPPRPGRHELSGGPAHPTIAGTAQTEVSA